VDDHRRDAESLRAPSPVDADARGLRRRLQYAASAPLAVAQQRFNDVVLRLFDSLSQRVDAAEARTQSAERRAAELEERLLRLERRPAASASGTVAPQPRASALPDYFAFEARLRGSTAEIRERQLPYVERLRAHAPVLDLGCGRGELLSLLRDAGLEARGADANADMVAFARGEGLDVEQADAHDALAACGDASLGAVTALQLLEHLPPPDLVALLRLAHAKLRPGGLLIAETIDPSSLAALRNFYADLTHAQPLVPETLELLVRGAGFLETETIHLNDSLDYAIIASK
jgi:2-polyprenyl-3-methyl-5-hydroxy-6-metoxy-1,4-benzoquinol methylase